MATAHIESKKEQIAKKVLMPGDPLRAKYIAEKYLTGVTCVNQVRGMLAYTGFYKDKRITVFASGMGGASIGIYAYELYHFYEVDKIIRIGTCGSNHQDIKVKDIVIASKGYTLSSYPKLFFNDDQKEFTATKEVVDQLVLAAQKVNNRVFTGEIITSDIFDVYVDKKKYMQNYPAALSALAFEMEGAILFTLAKHLRKEAGCILTVVDSDYDDTYLDSDQRERALDDMITIALEAI